MPKSKAKTPIFQVGIIALSLILFIYFLFHITTSRIGIFGFLFFILCIALAEYVNLSLPQGGHLSVSPAILIACLLLFSLSNVVCIAVAGVLISILVTKEKPRLLDALLFMSRFVLVISFSAAVYYFIGGRSLLSNVKEPINLFSWDIAPLVAVSLAYFLADIAISQIFLNVELGMPLVSAWKGAVRLLGSVYVALCSTGVLIALVYRSMRESYLASLWSILVFVPLFAVIEYAFKLYLDMRKGYQSTIMALSTAIEAQDPHRLGHAERVADFSTDVAKELGIHGEELELIRYAAMLHDIGKLGIDEGSLDKVLQKTGLRRKNETHADLGAEILEQVDYLKAASEMVKRHHQPYVGGKRGIDTIHPLGARIINVVDFYDHLTELRPPEKCLSPSKALVKLKQDQGFTFDPKVIRALSKVLESRGRL